MKYVIMADSVNKYFSKTPRQLTEINGEPIIKRTVRLLKENGIEDIIITSHDKRFDNLGATRYEPKHNNHTWKNKKRNGYWLNAFTEELLVEPICFLFGDVYYSENAIKTIVETEAKDNLFFCSYKNKNEKYIKEHDEPLAFKVVNCKQFLEHIEIVKKLYDEGRTVRHPISWELYRSLNNQDVNKHIMTNNYVVINDETCDIDKVSDIMLLRIKLGGIKLIRVEVIEPFTLERFNELTNIVRKGVDTKGQLNIGDIFECTEEMVDYLTKNNKNQRPYVKVIEVVPEKKLEVKKIKEVKKSETKKTTKRNKK